MKKIRVIIHKRTGKLTISAEGYEGQSCLEATKKLREGLGMTEPEREYKPEFYQQTEQEQQIGGS